MEVDGSVWKLVEVFGSTLKFLEVNGSKWKLMEVDGSRRKLMEVDGSRRWKLMEVRTWKLEWKYLKSIWELMEMFGS